MSSTTVKHSYVDGFQQIHEDLQVGAAVQENLFTVEVSRLACLCVDFCRLLYCCTEVSWSSGFCLRPGIWPLRSSPPKRIWKIVSLYVFVVLCGVAKMPRNVELPCNFCMYFSNTVNPFIYAGMNPIFRREFRKILCCAQRRNALGVSARVVPTMEEGRQGSTLPVVFTSERS